MEKFESSNLSTGRPRLTATHLIRSHRNWLSGVVDREKMARKRRVDQIEINSDQREEEDSNEIGSEMVSLIDLRPNNIPYFFPEEPYRRYPKREKAYYQWREFEIKPSLDTKRGKGLFIKNCPAGFLIPYGGIFISPADYTQRKRSSTMNTSENPELDYLYSVNIGEGENLQKGYFDSNPELTRYDYQWPAAYCNEIASIDDNVQRITRSQASKEQKREREFYNARSFNFLYFDFDLIMI